MSTKDDAAIVSPESIALRVVVLRKNKVLLDSDLAELYGVQTKVLLQAVKRNLDRFPADFMFQLRPAEVATMRSQFVTARSKAEGDEEVTANWSQSVTSSRKHRGATYRPYAFTEQGVAMLSSVLNSERAVRVNIAIMRAFVKLREAMETNRELAEKFAELSFRVDQHDAHIAEIIEAIRQLIAPPVPPKKEIGFHVRETPPRYRVRKR